MCFNLNSLWTFLTGNISLWNTAFFLISGVTILLQKTNLIVFGDNALKIKPSPHIKAQSVIVDKEKGIHGSALPWDTSLTKDIKVIGDVLRCAEQMYGNEPCLGQRPDFNSPDKWISYTEVYEQVRALGSGLVQLKLSRKFIGIYGKNCPEWVCTLNACGTFGFVSVPLYDTLGQEAMRYIMWQTEMRMIVCDTIERTRNLLKWAGDLTEEVVVMRGQLEDVQKLNEEFGDTAKIHHYHDILELGRQHPLENVPCNPDDMFLVCYTSGSTGVPKGVIHTHRSFIHGMSLGIQYTPDRITLSGDTLIHISFLPLAHIMEQMFVMLTILMGCKIAFLTESISKVKQDCAFYRPSSIGVVPRLLNRIYDELMKKYVNQKWKKKLLNFAIRTKVAEQKRGIFNRSGILDYFLFRQIRKEVGGRLDLIICGSAPLRVEVRQFMQAALSCPIIEAYGMTESGGLVSATPMTDVDGNSAGAISPSVKVKLADVPSMDLIVERDGMGEVCVLSGACTIGYYRNDEATANLFDEDGFIHSGDIGQWKENGSLQIVDRCKSMFKLAQGEYVSPERIEQIYQRSHLVQQVFLDGNSSSSFAVALIVPDFNEIRDRLDEGVDEQTTDEDLCQMDSVKLMVIEELHKLGKESGLSGFEQAKVIHLTPKMFTQANGLLTPTMKVARANVRKHFHHVIDQLYEDNK